MNEILEQLKKWREDRNITESTENDYKANMFEELSEYYRSNNDHERIDALCDMAVFTVNHTELNNIKIFIKHILSLDDKELFLSYKKYPEFIENILVTNFIQSQREHFIFTNTLTNIRERVISLGFYFEKCMLETIKEISSRRQDPKQFAEWAENGANGKWIKDKNQDPSTLYKADYESCKLLHY
jgi:hypothetical protein